MATRSKQLVKEKGILSTPNPKPGSSLPIKLVDLIKNFYEFDDISRVMPGKKDFVSIREGEIKAHTCPETTCFEQSEGNIQ